ncbi:DNA-directed RNA polymerase, mitochondrial [Coccinella septempunctata]|uniref:DNA-directed RNA polymerase, mitochondrial n=1 Tax=Coccinella septempunctata TaxID=41139 RepID=UPI001D0957C5|nr:DNA-directed RNA polymerase, mitochondrial [Coccinella septempunctata]
MYRLFKYQTTRSNSLATIPFNADTGLTGKSCQFCRILQSYSKVPHRYQSTSLNPNPLNTGKVRKRRSKKNSTTELVEVSDKSTLQLMTKVQKANVNDLQKLLLMSPQINNLDSPKSGAFSSAVHTYDNLSVLNPSSRENIGLVTLTEKDWRILTMLGFNDPSKIPSGELFSNEDVPEISVVDEDSFEEISINEDYPLDESLDVLDSISTIDPILEEDCIKEDVQVDEKNKKRKKETKKVKEMPEEVKFHLTKKRKEMMLKTLAAYVETCVIQKMTKRAEYAISFYKHRSVMFKTVIDDVNIYNAFLKTHATRGHMKEIFDTLQKMEKEKIIPNLQTYIILLYGYGKSSIKGLKYKNKVEMYIKEAEKGGYNFNKLMNEGVFLNDERTIVLKTMRIFDPKFEPTYNAPLVQYNNELVNNLNHQDQLLPPKKGPECDGLFSSNDLRKRVLEQLDQEQQISITVRNIEAVEAPTEETLRCRKYLEELHKSWTVAATESFKKNLWCLMNQRGNLNYDIYLKCIPMEDFITIIVEEAKKLSQGSETYSPTVNMLYRDLGNQVYRRYLVLRRKNTGVLDKILSIHKEYCDHYASSHKNLAVLPTNVDNLNPRQKWQWLEHNLKPVGSTLDMDHREWVNPVLTHIGKFLYQIIMHDLKVDVNCMKPNSKQEKNFPAFYNIFRYENRKLREEVKPHPVLVKLMKASVPETLSFPVDEVPMVCPPVPWTSTGNGGYLITPSEMVRLPLYAQAQKKILKATPVQNLYPVFDSLNQLGSVPWKVNKKILDVITEVFNNGGSAKLDVPEPTSSLAPPVPPPNLQDLDKTERQAFLKLKMQYQRRKAEMYSLRCDCLYRLCLAHHFQDKVFWLPHNMDFRGRVYPLPPHLNHLGSDLARSMLVFAEPRPLGPNGLNWLKIHLINLTGQKKRDSVKDRLQYANECLDLIFDSADNPLDGKRWWTESDEPWQTLACCMEIVDVIRSGDPENYRSHFPVHQDGSCNGLQHYAALGRDKAGGYSVNLCPADVPQDVYSAVVTLVEERRKLDAERGVHIAKILEGHVKRKVIKQTIMTSVYGVTWFGARLQIAKQLKDIDDFPKDQVYTASNYLTTKTFESLRSMFTSTKEIQDWFTECAKLISSVAGQHIEWVTPLGLPIVQPYIKYRVHKKNSVYEPYLDDKFEKPNVVKHKNAFPPNFIHSLDSSHMMLTSLNCERKGLTFVSVHDCFWTHPSTVEIMNKICREQFVTLHSQPILEDLSLYLSQKYSYSDSVLANDGSVLDLTKKKMNKVLCNLPRTGDLDINQVLESVYFFS